MKIFKSCLLAVVLTSLPSAAKAEQVDWGATGNFITLGNTQAAPVGFSILLGHFTTGFTFAPTQNYATLIANFQTYDTSAIGEGGGGPGQFFAQTSTNPDGTPASTVLPGTAGDQLYMWAFNNANPAQATEWAIISNVLWVRPPSGATTFSFDASELGTFVPNGARGQVVNNGTPTTGGDIRTQIAPIPEPSTYALALVGLGVAAGVARRRRQAVG